jgi:SAM-dependent methyltransferase
VAPLALEQVDCPLCGAASAVQVTSSRDVALGVPGVFWLARCGRCGLLYQNPRVRVDHLDRAYPPHYAAHVRDSELPRIVRSRGRAVRFVLRAHLGYGHLDVADVGWRDRVAGRWRRRKIVTAFPPWHGRGRLLDVGCASGKFLGQMRAMGWSVAGVELDPEAAQKAKTITPDVFVGDPVDAPFAPASFDVITAFHVIEHLPFPREALGRMLAWQPTLRPVLVGAGFPAASGSLHAAHDGPDGRAGRRPCGRRRAPHEAALSHPEHEALAQWPRERRRAPRPDAAPERARARRAQGRARGHDAAGPCPRLRRGGALLHSSQGRRVRRVSGRRG